MVAALATVERAVCNVVLLPSISRIYRAYLVLGQTATGQEITMNETTEGTGRGSKTAGQQHHTKRTAPKTRKLS
jgi:hypothetical protein